MQSPIKEKYLRLLIIISLGLLFNGCTDDEDAFYTELDVVVVNSLPQALFSYKTEISDTIRTGHKIHFINNSKNGQAYFWDFNDGTFSNEKNPIQSFEKRGLYTIRLKVINSKGIDSTSIQINVNCKYNNFVEHGYTIREIEHINVLTARYRSKDRFCIELSQNEAIFGFDTITGKGFAIQLICNGALHPSTFTAIAGSKYIPNLSKTNRNETIVDLSGTEIQISVDNNFIELYLKTDTLEINYKGLYFEDHYYNFPTIKEIEQNVRATQDGRASHTYNQYEELLMEISKDKYLPMTIWDMYNNYNENKVIVGMRHDVDCHPFKALEMAKMEQAYGINASYYILATSNYYGQFYPDSVRRNRALDKLYLELYNLGAEIGIHNDLLTVMISKKLDPFTFNWNEINYYESLGIPIYGNVGHGSAIASQVAHNSQMFSDFAKSETVTYKGETYPIGTYSMLEYGFFYEANFFPFNQYYSESGGRWSIDGGFDEVMRRIKNSKPGDRIQILTHPVWWGK